MLILHSRTDNTTSTPPSSLPTRGTSIGPLYDTSWNFRNPISGPGLTTEIAGPDGKEHIAGRVTVKNVLRLRG
jgi:hypothetical protein